MGKYCEHCGHELMEESKFCPKCGKTIADKKTDSHCKKQDDKEDFKELMYNFLGLNKEVKEVNVGETFLYNESALVGMTILMCILGFVYYIDLYTQSGGFWWFTFFYVMINAAVWSYALSYGRGELPIYMPVLSVTASSIILTEICGKYTSDAPWWILGGFLFHIIQGIIWIICVGFFVIFFKHIYKKGRSVQNKQERIRWELREREKNKEIYERLLTLKDERIVHYINRAIELYNTGDYEDATVNVRKILECFFYAKIEHDNVIFDNEKDLTLYNMIEYYKQKRGEAYDDEYRKDRSGFCYHDLRVQCNNGAHVANVMRIEYSEEEIRILIYKMIDMVSWQTNVFDGQEVCKKYEEKMSWYIERAETYAEKREFEDSLLNLRKSLECIVYGYMKCRHLICAYGHEKNLNGYIDMLCEKGYIEKRDKSIMQHIRAVSNQGAHIKKSQTTFEELQSMIKQMKEVIDRYKNQEVDNLSSYEVIEDGVAQDNQEIDDYEPEHYGNREMSMGKYRHQYDYEDDYEGPVKKNEERELMPSEMNDPYKQTDPYRANDPYVQSCPPEEYYIKW